MTTSFFRLVTMIHLGAHLFRWGPIPGALLWVNQWRSIFRPHPSYYPKPWPETLLLFRGKLVLFLCDNDELEHRGLAVFQRWLLPARQREKSCHAWKKVVRGLSRFTDPLTPAAVRGLSDEELSRAWDRLHRLTDEFWRIGIIPELAAYGAAPELIRALHQTELSEERAQRFAAALSAPEGHSFYQKEERDLLSLYRLPVESRRSALAKHARRYAWIRNSYAGALPSRLDFFARRFVERKSDWKKRLAALQSHADRVRKRKERCLRALPRSRSIREFSGALSFAVGWQDERKGEIFRYLTFVDRLAREIARRNRLSLRLLSFALSEEVSARLRPRLIRSLRQRARQKFGVIMTRQGNRVIIGREAEKLDARFWRQKPADRAPELQGIVAHPGRAAITGTVFVVRSHRDLERFPARAVLVTAMTAPEYVVAMRRARAVVTDEGGITSHAAIVSRELNLPCIVGTRYATQVLKTGDRVQIDARRGVIDRLSNLLPMHSPPVQ